MVNVSRIQIKRSPPESISPLQPVPLIINDIPTTGRPYEFDQPPVDKEGFRGADGNYIKPIKCCTSCPECGAGLQVPLQFKGDPPFPSTTLKCNSLIDCKHHPLPTPMPDPFVNPFANGDIDIHYIETVEVNEESTVMERISRLVPLPKASDLTEEEDV